MNGRAYAGLFGLAAVIILATLSAAVFRKPAASLPAGGVNDRVLPGGAESAAPPVVIFPKPLQAEIAAATPKPTDLGTVAELAGALEKALAGVEHQAKQAGDSRVFDVARDGRSVLIAQVIGQGPRCTGLFITGRLTDETVHSLFSLTLLALVAELADGAEADDMAAAIGQGLSGGAGNVAHFSRATLLVGQPQGDQVVGVSFGPPQ